jgi:cell division protein FtsB
MEDSKKKKRFHIDTKKIVFGVAIIVLFFLVMDLNNRLSDLSRLSSQKEDAETVVANLQQTLNVLNTQMSYATSDAAVEEWAYEYGHMVRPGEHLIIPLEPNGATQAPLVIATQVSTQVTNWEIWMALFTGQ